MATLNTAHQINVYASLPLNLMPGGVPDVHPDNWAWIHCLALPLQTLDMLQFCQSPYKWIHYIIGVVIGTQGVLCTSPDSPEAVDHNAVLPTRSVQLYYHTSNKEKQRMFPVDPSFLHTPTTPNTNFTPQRDEFYCNVAERDGEQCVLTSAETKHCNAVHLLPQSRGDMVCYTLFIINLSLLTISIIVVYFNIYSLL
jgi:hypothetical protein